MQFENTIIYLVGFGGVGKYTIAKEIAKLADFRIVHNHLVNNPIFNIINIEEGHIPLWAWQQVRQIRDVVFTTIEKYSSKEMNFIFTNELIDGSEGDLKLYKKILKLAETRKSKFIPVRLQISEDEHRKRIISPERKESFKVSDVEYVDRISVSNILKIDHENLINLDTTKLAATESAKYILNKINAN